MAGDGECTGLPEERRVERVGDGATLLDGSMDCVVLRLDGSSAGACSLGVGHQGTEVGSGAFGKHTLTWKGNH